MKNTHLDVFQNKNQGTKTPIQADSFNNLSSLKFFPLPFSLWSLIKNQSREHPIQIICYSTSKKNKKSFKASLLLGSFDEADRKELYSSILPLFLF